MAAITNGGAPTPTQPLSASITPSSVYDEGQPKGSYKSPLFVCSGSGGTPPYTYEWSVTTPFSLSGTDGNETRAATGGASGEQTGTISCTVTDSDTNTVTVEAPITVIFGGLGL